MTQLADKLSAGALVITAGRRLARHLHRQFAEYQKSLGNLSWETPAIYSWQAWLKEQWQILNDKDDIELPLLLNETQTQQLWEGVVRESTRGEPLLQVPAAAVSAAHAWSLMQEWQIGEADVLQWGNEDSHSFLLWSRKFAQRCNQHNWIDPACLQASVTQALHSGQIGIPLEIVLAGFDSITPAQHKLLQILKNLGCTVEEMATPVFESRKRVTAYRARDEEVFYMARWVRDCLEKRADARIGVVVPDIAADRTLLERALDEVLHPDSDWAGHNNPERVFNISLGRALIEYPLVDTAMQLLMLSEQTVSLNRIGQLLRSPFIGGYQAEWEARALLDAHLRERDEPELSLATLLSEARGRASSGESLSWACPDLMQRLQQVRDANHAQSKKQDCAQWSRHIDNLLGIAGWPGERSLDSSEYQQVQRWHRLLSELAGLELVHPQLTLSQAISVVQQLAKQTIFQPESADVPVQVMGMLEANGLQFDHLWIMGLHDEAWPLSPRPHPLLPSRLQRELGMPHASAQVELEYARGITDRLLAAAPEIVISYPENEADKKLNVSPLVRHLVFADREEIEASSVIRYRDLVHQNRLPLELARDKPVPLFDVEQASGGTSILKYQAACPFSAYTALRLNARGLKEAEPGLSAMDRGNLVHRILELLWGKFEDQQTLLAKKAQWHRIVNECIEQTITDEAWKKPHLYTENFIKLEKERLQSLVLDWLELELQRKPFAVVRPEQDVTMNIGPLRVRGRIDRVDELTGGERIIIDYKTGETSITDWEGERLREPQLPVYACHLEHTDRPPAAVLFAQIKPGKLFFKGVSDVEGIAPGIKVSDDEAVSGNPGSMTARWRTVLESLARSYAQGEAQVDPRDALACRYCEYPMICRIHELNQRLGYLADGEDEVEVGSEE